MDNFKPCGCLTDGRNWLPECKEHENVRRRLRAAQEDAERYRFLRDNENAFPLCFIAQRTSSPRNVVVQFSGATADSMVDAMMKLRTDATGDRSS